MKIIIMGDMNDDPDDASMKAQLGDDRSTLKFLKNEVFRRDYMIQTEGNYKGYLKRTHAGGVWLNGYSDHLPTIIYIIKEVN